MDTQREESEGGAGPAAAPAGLAATLRGLGAQALEMLQIRIELFGTEWQVEKLRIFGALAGLVLALLLAGAALVMLSLALVWLCPPPWHWAAALLLALAYAGLAWLAWRRALLRLNPPGGAFALTLAELARDREQLTGR